MNGQARQNNWLAITLRVIGTLIFTIVDQVAQGVFMVIGAGGSALLIIYVAYLAVKAGATAAGVTLPDIFGGSGAPTIGRKILLLAFLLGFLACYLFLIYVAWRFIFGRLYEWTSGLIKGALRWLRAAPIDPVTDVRTSFPSTLGGLAEAPSAPPSPPSGDAPESARVLTGGAAIVGSFRALISSGFILLVLPLVTVAEVTTWINLSVPLSLAATFLATFFPFLAYVAFVGPRPFSPRAVAKRLFTRVRGVYRGALFVALLAVITEGQARDFGDYTWYVIGAMIVVIVLLFIEVKPRLIH